MQIWFNIHPCKYVSRSVKIYNIVQITSICFNLSVVTISRYKPISIWISIRPTYAFSMQELIMQGMQRKIEKTCFRCNKNTWYVESNCISQLSKYLIIVVNRFRYIDNDFTKGRCTGSPYSKPASYRRSSRTIYVFWPLYYPYQLLKKHSIATTSKLWSLKWLMP